jgi:hypothetical protein
LERVIEVERKRFFRYSEFEDIKVIGVGAYGTVYKAECNERFVVLKRLKNFDQMPELFITEVGDTNH